MQPKLAVQKKNPIFILLDSSPSQMHTRASEVHLFSHAQFCI